MQLSRGAGPSLRPHLPLLLGALLDALSDLEPPLLSQLSVQADADARDRVSHHGPQAGLAFFSVGVGEEGPLGHRLEVAVPRLNRGGETAQLAMWAPALAAC